VAAKSTDGKKMAAKLVQITNPPGKAYTWKQLPKAIDALRSRKDIDYVGASGPLDLNADGDPTKGAYDLFEFTKYRKKVGSISVPASR
jgi:hypothetical protein